MTRERLSILTKDNALAQTLCTVLGQAGYETQVSSTAPKYWQRARAFLSALLIVDLDGLGSDPLTQCRRLRALIPARIMALSSNHDEDHIAEAFAAGVDEYLRKPVTSAELVARTEALLRRQRQQEDSRASRLPICPDVALDTHHRTLHVRGRRVRLSPIEYSLLDCLARNSGTVVSRSALLRQGWGEGQNPSVESLNLYIYYLRRKIEHDPRHPEHILTKWGVGYYLVP